MGSLHGSLDAATGTGLIEDLRVGSRETYPCVFQGQPTEVALVAAFATRAEVLLLDEPTSGLDPLMERVFRDCIIEAQQRGQAVLLSSHMISEVEHLCGRVAMIRSGKLVSVADVEELGAHVGTEFEIHWRRRRFARREGSDVGVRPARWCAGASRWITDALLQALAKTHVTSLRTKEASLEEIFLSFYGPVNGTAFVSRAPGSVHTLVWRQIRVPTVAIAVLGRARGARGISSYSLSGGRAVWPACDRSSRTPRSVPFTDA